MTLARACRDHEHVTADYVDRSGSPSRRRLEPYQIVTTGRRWYLLAFDRDRTDWRSLRLDRMAQVRALGSTFIPRPAPDAAEYVRRAISASPYRHVARVRYRAPESILAQHFSPASAAIETGRSGVVRRRHRRRRPAAAGAGSGHAGHRLRDPRPAGGGRRRPRSGTAAAACRWKLTSDPAAGCRRVAAATGTSAVHCSRACHLRDVDGPVRRGSRCAAAAGQGRLRRCLRADGCPGRG